MDQPGVSCQTSIVLNPFWAGVLDSADGEPPTDAELKEREEIEAFNRRLEEKADRRAERTARCGIPIHRLDPATGMRVKVIPHCDNWHECENCRRLRTMQVASLVSVVVSKGPTWALWCRGSSDEAAEAVRGGKASYLSLPLEKEDEAGCDLLVLVDHPVHNSVVVRPADVNSWDMENVACTPEGRRMTGHLRKPAAAGAKKGETLRLLGFTTEAPEIEIVAAFTEAVLATTGEDPKNGKEVEEANYRRVARWAEILRNKGYVTACAYHDVKLSVLNSWCSCTFNFLRERGLVFPKRAPKGVWVGPAA